MKKFYLFRHGETDWNKERRIQCSIDIELNKTGLKQAEKNAENLKDYNIQHIYSSPLKRAYKTGEILANKINVEIEIIEDLKERFGGNTEGMTFTELKKEVGEEDCNNFFHSKEYLDLSLLNCETKRQYRKRISDTIKKTIDETKYNIVAFSSHSAVILEFLRAYNYPDDSKIDNCEIIEGEYKNGEIKIIKRIKCDIE